VTIDIIEKTSTLSMAYHRIGTADPNEWFWSYKQKQNNFFAISHFETQQEKANIHHQHQFIEFMNAFQWARSRFEWHYLTW